MKFVHITTSFYPDHYVFDKMPLVATNGVAVANETSLTTQNQSTSTPQVRTNQNEQISFQQVMPKKVSPITQNAMPSIEPVP